MDQILFDIVCDIGFYFWRRKINLLMQTTLKTRPELEKMLDDKRNEYRQARHNHDLFMMKKTEWEGKYIQKLLDKAVLGDIDPSVALTAEKMFDVAQYIFG